MIRKNFDIFVNINSEKISIAIFKKNDGNCIFYKESDCLTNLATDKLNFLDTEKILEESIIEAEKATGEFINDINLMVETPETMSVNLSVMHDNEEKQIDKKNVEYLIQDAKQQILRSYYNKKIIHIIVSNYFIDNVNYELLPLNIKCKKFSIDIKFICFPKIIVNKLEQLFNNHHLLINNIICTEYVRSFFKNKIDSNICKSGLRLVLGMNKQEVAIIPKKLEKKGFFERLFHIFK